MTTKEHGLWIADFETLVVRSPQSAVGSPQFEKKNPRFHLAAVLSNLAINN